MNVRWGALAVVLVASSATAEDQHAFRLSYSAPPGCASREAFSAAIESNGIRAHHVGPGQTAIDVDARIEIRGDGFLGVLRIGRPDGTTTTRSLPAASCDEAASAMALIASIAIDPEAAAAASQQLPEAAAGASPVAASAASAASPAPPAPTAAPAPAPTAPADKPPAAAERERPHARAWQLGVNGGVGLTGAIAPEVSPDYHLGFGFGATPRKLLSPLVLLSAHLAESADVVASEGTAQFQRIGGRLTGCPLTAKAGPVLLRPCLLFEVGQLKATGSHITPPRTTRILWLELGTTVRGELTLFGPLSLTAELGAGFPLIDDSFHFSPSGNSIHQVPPVGFLGALELGVRIM